MWANGQGNLGEAFASHVLAMCRVKAHSKQVRTRTHNGMHAQENWEVYIRTSDSPIYVTSSIVTLREVPPCSPKVLQGAMLGA